MNTQLTTLLDNLKANSITFKDVIEFIETYYTHQPTAFKNGDAYNEATQNQGSAKVFAFAKLNQLGEEDTLHLLLNTINRYATHLMVQIIKTYGSSWQMAGRG